MFSVFYLQTVNFKLIALKLAYFFRSLETGEEFYLIADDARLVCKDDYEQARDKRK